MLIGNVKWDVEYSLFFFVKLSQRFLEDGKLEDKIDTFKQLSESLYVHTCDGKLETKQNIKTIEHLWSRLLQLASLANSDNLPNVTEFKVCLCQIGYFILAKSRQYDYRFCCNLFAFCLGVIDCCLKEQRVTLAEFLIKASSTLSRITENDDIPGEFQAKFRVHETNRQIYRIISLHHRGNTAEILQVMSSVKDKIKDLNEQQHESLASIAFRIGFHKYGQEQYEEAIIWFRMAYSHDKDVKKFSEKTLTLMAVCYMQWDAANYWFNVTELLDFAEINSFNLQLKLRAMIVGEMEPTTIASCATQYLQLLLEETKDSDAIQQTARQIFELIATKQGVIDLLLDNISSVISVNEANHLLFMPIRWICARYAIRRYSRNNQSNEFFQLLCQMCQWQAPDDEMHAAIIGEILTLAESVAVGLRNDCQDNESAVKWYECIVKMSSVQEIPATVLWNAARCAIDMSSGQGLRRARQFLSLVSSTEAKAQHFTLALHIAILGENPEEITQALLQIDNCILLPDDWQRLLNTMGTGIFAVLDNGKLETILNYLERAVKECKQHSMQIILFIFIIRVQLRNLQIHEDKNSILNRLVSTFENIHELVKDHGANEAIRIGGSPIEVWMGSICWNFGLREKRASCYRHEFFKLAYQFFYLINQSEENWREKAEIAAVVSMIAALENGDEKILANCIQITSEFYDRMNASHRIELIHLIEFHALCLMGKWQQARNLFVGKIRNNTKFWRNAIYLHSLAAIAIVAHENTICDHKFQADPTLPFIGLAVHSLEAALQLDACRKIDTFPLLQRLIDVSMKNCALQSNSHDSAFAYCKRTVHLIVSHSSDFSSQDVDRLLNKMCNSAITLFRRNAERMQRWIQLGRALLTNRADVQSFFERKFTTIDDMFLAGKPRGDDPN